MTKETDVAEHQERFEVISRFADGERVDTRALRGALADEAGRDYLIDLVAMREIVQQVEGSTSGRVTGTDLASSITPRTSRTPASTRRAGQWSGALAGLAAAMAVAVGLVGYAIGQQRSTLVPVAVLPPLEADVTVTVEAPPAPTQVINLGDSPPARGGR